MAVSWGLATTGSSAASSTMATGMGGAIAARETFQLQVLLDVEEIPLQPQVGWAGWHCPHTKAQHLEFAICPLPESSQPPCHLM